MQHTNTDTEISMIAAIKQPTAPTNSVIAATWQPWHVKHDNAPRICNNRNDESLLQLSRATAFNQGTIHAADHIARWSGIRGIPYASPK
jgi:hypothetical protein